VTLADEHVALLANLAAYLQGPQSQADSGKTPTSGSLKSARTMATRKWLYGKGAAPSEPPNPGSTQADVGQSRNSSTPTSSLEGKLQNPKQV
jgi:hypothetical protein